MSAGTRNGFKVVIPARFGSSRLPGKPLLDIAGRPMVLHVCDRALESGADEVIVATDDPRIYDRVRSEGLNAMMTRPEHANGTERIAEVCRRMNWDTETVVVNLQGDEPLVPPRLLRTIADRLERTGSVAVATLATPFSDSDDLFDPGHVKVVLNAAAHALYFSRAPIPWDRDRFHSASASGPLRYPCLRHIGIYAYTVGFLQRYTGWAESGLEKVEALEQLRILWHGEPISVITVDDAPEAGVDTPADLERTRQKLLASLSQ